MIDLGERKRPEVIGKANKRLNQYMLTSMACMFVYGILIPADWKTFFGIFGEPISWASKVVPAIDKLARVSPIPELVLGFVGLSSLAVPILGLLTALKDPMRERIRFAFSRPEWPFLKAFGFIYLLGCPCLVALLWAVYVLPINIDVTGGHTWGGQVLASLIAGRFALAFYGAILTGGLGLLVFFLLVYFIGPISLFLGKDKK